MTSLRLTTSQVLVFHSRQLVLNRQALGVRDAGQLEAAVFRPQTGCCEDFFREAAALWESLSRNQPFVDGNMRTSLAVATIFLLIKGWRLVVKGDEAYSFIIGLYEAGQSMFDNLDTLISSTAAPLNPKAP